MVEVPEGPVSEQDPYSFVASGVVRGPKSGRSAAGAMVVHEVAVDASDQKVGIKGVGPGEADDGPTDADELVGQVLAQVLTLIGLERET